MNTQAILPIILIVFGLIWGCAGSSAAKKRNRNQVLWFFNCMLSGLLALLVLHCSSPLKSDEEQGDAETDVLGIVVFFLSIIIFLLSVWYGYTEAKAYHERMMWNYYFHMMR